MARITSGPGRRSPMDVSPRSPHAMRGSAVLGGFTVSQPTVQSTAFGTDGSVRLGSNDLDFAQALVPARDGGLVIVRAEGLRRILPTGQLDARFGTACSRPLVARNVGAAASADGEVLTTTIDSLVVRYGTDGCAAPRPLRLRAVSAGSPLLRGPPTTIVGATYNNGLAVIRIRR
jgi:hypothetical protein